MSKLFVVGHGINVRGIYEDENAANLNAAKLFPIDINNVEVAATVAAVDADKYVVEKERQIVIERKGGRSFPLNRCFP